MWKRHRESKFFSNQIHECSTSILYISWRRVPSGQHTKSYWPWPILFVDLPMKDGDFPRRKLLLLIFIFPWISCFRTHGTLSIWAPSLPSILAGTCSLLGALFFNARRKQKRYLGHGGFLWVSYVMGVPTNNSMLIFMDFLWNKPSVLGYDHFRKPPYVNQ